MIRFGQRLAAAVAASFLLLSVVGAAPAAARAPSSGWSHRDARVCRQPAAGQARCLAIARSFYRDGRKLKARTTSRLAAVTAAAEASWYDGTSIRTAYGITAVGNPATVVAIVDAYDDPGALANLARFRSDSGLPAIQSCTLATLTSLTSTASSPCITKTNQTGGTSLPSADVGWSNEIDLDLQAASAVCPMCSILLLEASSASMGNLGTAVTTASNTAHVLAISNSYGISGDYPGAFATAFDNAAKKGIAVTASAGDGGYGVLFPASATNVIGVGGTTLSVDGAGVRTTETAWTGTGSGCSVYNAAPAWQSVPGNPCAGKKAISDLSADADPNSGLAIFTTYTGVTGYWIFGGTSLSSPLVAALYAMQGGYDASTLAGKYAWAAGTPYFDVTSGSNGTCSQAGPVHGGRRLGRPDRARQHLHGQHPSRPDVDRRLARERFRPYGRDATVQRDRQGPVRPTGEPAADADLVGHRRRHDRRVWPVHRRIDRRRPVHGDRIKRWRERDGDRDGDERVV